MTESQGDVSKAEPGEAEAIEAETPREPSEPARQPRSGRWLAFFTTVTFLLALAAIGLALWLWQAPQVAGTGSEPLSERLDEIDRAFSGLEQRFEDRGQTVSEIEQRADARDQTLAELEQRFDSREETVAGLEQRLDDREDDRERTFFELEQRLEDRDRVLSELEQRFDDRDQTLAELEQRLEAAGPLAERLDQVESTLADLAGERERLETLEARLADLADDQQDLQQNASGLDESINSVNATVSELASRLEGLEADLGTRIDELAEQRQIERADARELERSIRLVEVATLLRLGQERAELAGDLAGARQSYGLARERLDALDDARLSRISRALADEIEALAAVEEPDWVAIQARLAGLADGSRNWPLAAEETDTGPARTETEDDGESGWRSGVRDALGQLVRVQPRGEAQLTDDQVSAVREQLALRLTAAELSAARRDSDQLHHHLERTLALVERWFDGQADDVAAARAALEALAGTEPAQAPSGLGRARSMLRDEMESS